MLKAYGIKDKYNASKAKSIWHETMGPTISSYTENIYVKKGRLHINISSAALRQEISFAKDKIKKIINEELEEEFIKDVIIW